MKVKVLGKYGPYGQAGTGAASGYLVTAAGKNILLDCGPGVLTRLLQACPTPDAVFISHLHFDHTSDLLPYRYFLETVGQKMPVFCQKDSSPWYDVLFTHPLFDIRNVTDKETVVWEGITMTFFKTQHPAPCLGVRISDGVSTMVYTGDTKRYEGIEKDIGGADLVLCDCSKPAAFVGGHMTVKDAEELAAAVKGKLIATHITPFEDPVFSKNAPENIEIAIEGKEYIF